MKDYSKEIKELQAAGSKLSDGGNHEVGNMLYLAAVDLEDLWTQYQVTLKELWKLQEEGSEEKIRCNTCKNNDDELSGECYEYIKGIFDHYEPQESEGT